MYRAVALLVMLIPAVCRDIFARRVSTLATQEGSAYGAALLAMTGTGAFASVPEACRATITETESLIPGPGAHTYRERYRLFNEIYPALKPIYGRL